MTNIINILTYSTLITAIYFLSIPKIAYKGNLIAFCAIFLSIIYNLTFLTPQKFLITIIIILLAILTSIFLTNKTTPKSLPQNVALLNGLGGLSSSLIGITELYHTNSTSTFTLFIISLGFITFFGSISSITRLNDYTLPLSSKTIKTISLSFLSLTILNIFFYLKMPLTNLSTLFFLSSFFSFTFVLSIKKTDMSIIISILNSLSGFITSLLGLITNSNLLLITGTIIGISGFFLTFIMTKSMNRKLLSVLFSTSTHSPHHNKYHRQNINLSSPKDIAFLLENAHKVIIVPGFGMAVSNAEDELKILSDILKNKYNVDIKFAIHPIAGRMPGHLNILLAKADIPLSQIYELKDINHEFKNTDVALIVGANDIINPLAQTDKNSPIYQMPILEAQYAHKIVFAKRSLSPGYSGLDNPLFYEDKTLFLLGDAKETLKKLISELE